jgi:hypothetical protein
MTVEVILCNSGTESVLRVGCADISDAFGYIATVVQMGRSVDRAKEPELMPRLRDQVLLNLARYLTDGEFSAAAQEVFTQLCAREERPTDETDVRLIQAWSVADSLTAGAVHNDASAWPDFDQRFEELKRMITEEGQL